MLSASYYAAAFSAQIDMLARLNGIRKNDPPHLVHNLPPPTYPSECPSCHSHEFRMHHGRWLCSFCRSSA